MLKQIYSRSTFFIKNCQAATGVIAEKCGSLYNPGLLVICLVLDQFSSIYDKVKSALLNHVHFHYFFKLLSELILVILQFKNGISQNRFIVVQLTKLKQLTQTAKRTEYTAYVESSIDRILVTLEEWGSFFLF